MNYYIFGAAILALICAIGAALWAYNFGTLLFVFPIVYVWILKQTET